LIARLLVAETELEQPTARLDDRRQAFDAAAAIFVAEHMEQAGIDQRVENFGKLLQGQGVHHKEGCRKDLEISLGFGSAGQRESAKKPIFSSRRAGLY